VDLLFPVSRVAREDIPYLGILKAVLGMVDTKHYAYQELNNEINMNTGGISAGISVYPVPGQEQAIQAFAGIRARVLYDKLPFAFEMTEEILLHSVFEDEKRLYEILARLKSRLSMQLSSAGHSTAAVRALSYISQINAFNDTIGGITFYQLVEDLEKNFDEKKDQLKAKLQQLTSELFGRDGLIVSLTCDAQGLELTKTALEAFAAKLPQQQGEKQDNTLQLSKKNEGFMTPGQVQYVARAGNFCREGYEYTGALRILKILMGYDYLWTNIRVKGGAYGCMSSFGRSGDSYFVSYRDPHLGKTNEVYEGVPAYLEQFDADEREMTKYIIGTISELDTPMTPSIAGSRSMNAYFTGLTFEEIQAERDAVLSATPQQIRDLAPLVRAMLKDDAICVIGNEEKIRKEQELFASIQMLTN
jgi:Zn-dependent M16 (insulinase) family peptidase